MAFHVACPITCRRICFCPLGFPRASNNDLFNDVVSRLGVFVSDPSGIRVSADRTVQVVVPKVVPPPPPPPSQVLPPCHVVPAAVGVSAADCDLAVEEAASAQAKRVALQRKGAAAMIAAEEYARRFESPEFADTSGNITGEELGQSNVKVFCRMCNRVENEGSERAKKMLSCKNCSKKYHRNCLRSWGQHRDLFHWSSWTCRACRICEACRRTGDPSKFMFCKRCDGAYHCYCLHPPHKNVSNGPYLCPKHTRCHSCGSNVPGNGLSLRWFLGYTCCDACGRLFGKGNYCPVCLKVYRDSEPTPMVCCDSCQRWVHCQCDNISDERYHQFQVDGNLQYKCPTCRGECYQVRDLEDAVQELWRRRDIDDRDLIASLRAAAGLPTQEEIFSISPYSDDEDSGPGRSYKFSLKNFSDKSPKTTDYRKKSSSKKHSKRKASQLFMNGKTDPHHSFEGHSDVKSLQSLDNVIQYHRNESHVYSSPAAGSLSQTEGSYPVNQPGTLRRKSVDDVMVSDEERKSRVVRIKSNKAHTLDSEDESGKHSDKSQNVKGKKLVINFGARKINVASSPRSDTSSCQKDNQYQIAPNGNKTDAGQSKVLKASGREGNFIKLGKLKSEVSQLNSISVRGNVLDGCEAVRSERPRIFIGKNCTDGVINQVGAMDAMSRDERLYLGKLSEGRSGAHDDIDNNNNQKPSHSLPKDPKPSLKIKFKKPSIENENTIHGEEEKITIKGQRSKRKRPSPFMEKKSFNEDEDVAQSHEDMDVNLILMKLGKGAIGKRVEVHQTSDKSWHKGVVTDTVDGTSKLHVTLDDGRVNTLELSKQAVRFVPPKEKKSRT
ncbi:unnamed protein product [Lupinus luteus]|uniref:PHD-type domain-containing protein n=1 Tax=Lupinus luteus TaxID=3873 RepID=A0AAV1XYW0_LUPLU